MTYNPVKIADGQITFEIDENSPVITLPSWSTEAMVGSDEAHFTL